VKRILLADASPAVEQTLTLLLARDYEVIGRDSGLRTALSGSRADGVDLVIAGSGSESAMAQLKDAIARGETAVLFLLESHSVAETLWPARRTDYLVKPFTPYQLKAAVERLLSAAATASPGALEQATTRFQSYLGFPFVSRATAAVAGRFAALPLPVLLWGELGCGQDRIARAMLGVAIDDLTVVNAAEVSSDYLIAKRAKLSDAQGARPPVLIEGLERLSIAGQSILLDFLDSLEGSHGRLLTTANADLLERVYRGEFLERLYHKAAALTLPLKPLRRRGADIPALATWFATALAPSVGLTDVRCTQAAIERLRAYLWFGNILEFEMVIGHTLAIHGKNQIDAPDLIFDVAQLLDEAPDVASTSTHKSVRRVMKASNTPSAVVPTAGTLFGGIASTSAGHSPSGLRLLVHELAHELKNPMVTIKTFAQLLTERYDDASFRARFHDVVDGDIERMDAILKVMSEFAGFDQPRKISIALKEYLSATLAAIDGDCARRQLRVGWKGNGQGVKIMADAAQLQYALKNTMLAILSQARMGSEIELALGEHGSLTISYRREGERTQALTNYVDDAMPDGASLLPLRIMLAREIVERSGGRFGMEQQPDGDREVVTMEFPVG
jgi:DNA-binding NtrC family response regulator